MKVLTDISLGGLAQGLSGIPQDSRWLFNTMTKLPNVEASALIYDTDFGTNWLRSSHTFFDQVQMLSKLFDTTLIDDYLQNKKRRFKKLYYLYTLYIKNRYALEKLHPYFKPLVYRKYLSRGNIDYKVMDRDFYLYFCTLGTHLARTVNNMSFPILDTKNFDFTIFQDVRGFRITHGKKIIRYHDSIPLTDLDVMAFSRIGAIIHYRALQQCVKDGSIFVTNSNTVRKKLCNLFPQLENRSYTIPYAISEQFYYEKKKIPYKYVLHVATIEPRKNQIGMVKAFKKFNEKYPDYKLVIVGQKGWKYEPIEKEMISLQKDKRLLYIDGLTPSELRVFYSNAEMFLFPSFNEGFGLPPIEAMACGTPVLSSDIDVHRDVQGEAATFADPYSVSDIAEKMIYIADNPEYAKNKIELGFKIAKKYSNEQAKLNWSYLLTNLYEQEKQKNPTAKKNRNGRKS